MFGNTWLRGCGVLSACCSNVMWRLWRDTVWIISFRLDVLSLYISFNLSLSGCTGLTLYGEVGGTVVFQCNSTREDVQSLYFQGGTDFRKVIIGYHKTKKHDEPSRPDTYLNHENKTVTFGNLTVSDNGTYKCIISHGDPGGITEDTTITLIITGMPPFTHSHSQQEHW